MSNLFEVQDSNGRVLASMDREGQLSIRDREAKLLAEIYVEERDTVLIDKEMTLGIKRSKLAHLRGYNAYNYPREWPYQPSYYR